MKISFDEHDGSPNKVRCLYHNKTEDEINNDMELLQDMNAHIIIVLIEVDKKSTYDKIIEVEDPRIIFMDSKFNWSGDSKSYDDLKDEYLEETLLESLKSGEMGVS